MSARRVFLYVQHLLGVGHLKRAMTLAAALAERGLEVTLASGGFEPPDAPPAGVRWVQLPAAGTADSGFSTLVDADGRPVDEAWKAARTAALLAAWRAADPEALIIELFPFGRRMMRFELLPLLEAARAAPRPPVIVCSVRDLLGGKIERARHEKIATQIETHFDHVLVHGDPSVVPFERTFLCTERIAKRIAYTGYIVDARLATHGDPAAGSGEVIVSAGGGAVGARLLETAIRARPLTTLAGRTWRVLAGVNLPAADFAALRDLVTREGGGKVVLERARRDFTVLLKNGFLSISQVGYNTTMELLQAGIRAVGVPFAADAEIEQTLRAQLLAERGLIELLEERELEPVTLAAAIERAAARPPTARAAIDLGGAARSAALIEGWAQARG